MSINFLSPQFIIPFLIVLAVLGVRVHYKATWKTVHRPFLVIISILSVALIIIMLYAAYRMAIKTFFSPAEKVLYCLLIVALIGLVIWLNVSNWRKWKNENKHKKL